MAVTPSGILSVPVDGLADLIASSSTFQSWVGFAGDSAKAKGRVYVTGRDGQGPARFERPFALVTLQDFKMGIDAPNVSHGMLWLIFEADVPVEDRADHGDAFYGFTNKVGAILDEMHTNMLNAASSYTQTLLVDLHDGPSRSSPEEEGSEGDYYFILFKIEYGLRT